MWLFSLSLDVSSSRVPCALFAPVLSIEVYYTYPPVRGGWTAKHALLQFRKKLALLYIHKYVKKWIFYSWQIGFHYPLVHFSLLNITTCLYFSWHKAYVLYESHLPVVAVLITKCWFVTGKLTFKIYAYFLIRNLGKKVLATLQLKKVEKNRFTFLNCTGKKI